LRDKLHEIAHNVFNDRVRNERKAENPFCIIELYLHETKLSRSHMEF